MKAQSRRSRSYNAQKAGGRPRLHLRTNTVRRSPIKNNFLLTVHDIAESEGLNPRHIVSLFEHYCSSDFICGVPSDSVKNRRQIPDTVWQRVCDHYNASIQSPYRRRKHDIQLAEFMEKSSVFIASEVTSRLIHSQVILEKMPSPMTRRLYQYLNWTMRMNKFAQTAAVMEGQNGRRLLLIDVELHDQRGEELYALCSPNDKKVQFEEWQLVSLLTAQKLIDLLGIDAQSLPRGVRAASTQFEQYHKMKGNLKCLKTQILENEDRGRLIRKWSRRSGNGHNTKTVTVSSFYDAVCRSLEDENVDLVPIVSRKMKTKKFSVDYLLPVQLGDEWVGVVYRDCEFVMVLLDRYDITNKAILCDPSFDVEGFEWFRNTVDRLMIVQDDDVDLSSMDSAYPLSASNESPSDSGIVPISMQYQPSYSNRCMNTTPLPVEYGVIQNGNISAEELLDFMQQVIRNAEHNKAYYGQYIGWRSCGQTQEML